jgi:hypothetical protein
MVQMAALFVVIAGVPDVQESVIVRSASPTVKGVVEE